MLAQLDDQKKERAIYYVSKKLTDGETRYTPLEKSCCAGGIQIKAIYVEAYDPILFHEWIQSSSIET